MPVKAWICIVVAVCLASCSKPVPQTLQASYVAKQNYSAPLAKLTAYPLDHPIDKIPSDVLPLMEMHWQAIGNQIPDRPLTTLEKKRFGVFVDPNTGNKWQLMNMFSEICGHVGRNGKAPTSGEDLIADGIFTPRNVRVALKNPKLYTPQWIENRVIPLVNPATGKLYSTYQSKSWSSLGIDVQVVRLRQPQRLSFLERLKSFKRVGYRLINTASQSKYTADIRVTLWGEKPGSVLYTETLHMY